MDQTARAWRNVRPLVALPVLSFLALLRFRFCWRRRSGCLGAGVLIGLPGLELLEQRFLVGVGRQLAGRRGLLEEIVKLAAGERFDPVGIEPLLGRRQSRPAGQRRRE